MRPKAEWAIDSEIDLARAKSEALENIYGSFKQIMNRVMLCGEGNARER